MNQDRMQFKAIDRETKEVTEITGFNLLEKVAKKYSQIYEEYKVENFANVDIIQSIGKRDKNNELIFDGDIVRFDSENEDGLTGVIEWSNDNYFYYIRLIKDPKRTFAIKSNISTEEVIGHKLTHPELLESK